MHSNANCVLSPQSISAQMICSWTMSLKFFLFPHAMKEKKTGCRTQQRLFHQQSRPNDLKDFLPCNFLVIKSISMNSHALRARALLFSFLQCCATGVFPHQCSITGPCVRGNLFPYQQKILPRPPIHQHQAHHHSTNPPPHFPTILLLG